ncbi:MAG: hypothetical protein KDA70_16865 [Planctomycetaceae bacterium]|nr:hypothetical protein [Planctomycetaceae bacterium]MCA9019054.1 hypothetical protein [Planctomycetaceae bacterium]
MILNSDPFPRYLLLLSSCFSIAGGCTEERTTLSAVPRFEAPETFQADGWNWRREEGFSRSDTAVLSRFFEIQPGMQGSPAVTGVPVIYHGIQNRKRYYWIQGTVDGATWSCVEYSQGRYQFLEGTGNPYRTGTQ